MGPALFAESDQKTSGPLSGADVIDRRNFFQPAFVLSATLLGHALQISNGFFDPRALAWLTAALACALVGAASHAGGEPRHNRRVVEVLLWVSIAWQLAQ